MNKLFIPELVQLLHQVDGQLGLAIYRGEGDRAEWKAEGIQLIVRIRATIKELEAE